MTERHLRAVLAEAERVAEQYDQIAQTTNSPTHEYLRYAVLRLLEGDANAIPEEVPQVDGVTVGYGRDQAMYDSWGSDVEWWDTVPPQDDCTRFRVFYPEDQTPVPRVILTVMAALGAWRVWEGNAVTCGSYDHRERREVHFLWPEGNLAEALLENRIQEIGSAVAPDGGQAGDIRDRMLVSDGSTSADDLEPRTKRAVEEAMTVSLLAKGGRYEVEAASGNRYEVDIIGQSCTCPDWQQRAPDGGCKHMRRVDHEIKQGQVPRPDGQLPPQV